MFFNGRKPLVVALSLIVIGAGIAISAPASAVGRSVSMSSSTQSLSGDGGGTVTITSGVPVAAPGTVSQSITQAFDPTRAQLTGSEGIIAPDGWALSYSANGTTFGPAPTSVGQWATIRAVRATGSIASGGDSNGLQIASGSGTGAVPVSGTFSSGGGGDGWDVAFDERGNVFNTFHHDGAWWDGFRTPGVHCHTRTGGSCGPGWPFSLRIADGITGPDGVVGQPWYHTNDQSMQWVDTLNNRIWIPTSMNDGEAARTGLGFVCVDVSNLSVGPAWCGGSIQNAFVRLSTSACGRDCALGLAVVNEKLFAWDKLSSKLLCLNPYGSRSGGLPGAPCTNQPFAISSMGTDFASGYSLIAAQGLVWGTVGLTAMCFDPTSMSVCAGWSGGAAVLTGAAPNTSFDVPTAAALPGAVCFTRYDISNSCFNANGTSNVLLSGTHASANLMAYLSGKLSTGTLPKHAVTTGTRVYWADGAWSGGGKINCWDASLAAGAGAACANWPVNISAYTATIDAQNPNCIWTNTDSGTIGTIDAITGGSTCVTPPPIAEFSASVVIPRLACTTSSSIQHWRSFSMTAPAESTYSTATLTVLTSTGSVIPGWNRVAITSGSRTVDLSSLTVATSGTNPRFRIALNNKTTNDPIIAEVSAVGDAPQLCLPLRAIQACPIAPMRVAGALVSPGPILVTSTGDAQPLSGSAEQFTTASSSIAVTPPTDAACLGSISGIAEMNQTAAPVMGALVRLLDSAGTTIAVSTTDINGAYTFDRVVAGFGYRVEFGPTTQSAANNATALSASTNRTVTANSATTVNGTYALLRTNVLTGSATHNQPVTLMPIPTDSSGTQNYSAFTKSNTCVIDPSDLVCKTTVLIAGEGSWSINTTSGEVVFTPLSTFVGTTSAVSYQVTETSSSWTTWNLATATINPPVPTTTIPVVTTVPSVIVSATSTTVVTTTSSIPRPIVTPPDAESLAVITGTLTTSIIVPSAGRVTQVGTGRSSSDAKQTEVMCRANPIDVIRASTIKMNCVLTQSLRTQLSKIAVTVTLTTKHFGKDGIMTVTHTKVKLPQSILLPETR